MKTLYTVRYESKSKPGQKHLKNEKRVCMLSLSSSVTTQRTVDSDNSSNQSTTTTTASRIRTNLKKKTEYNWLFFSFVIVIIVLGLLQYIVLFRKCEGHFVVARNLFKFLCYFLFFLFSYFCHTIGVYMLNIFICTQTNRPPTGS